jgi:hypothetical protein
MKYIILSAVVIAIIIWHKITAKNEKKRMEKELKEMEDSFQTRAREAREKYERIKMGDQILKSIPDENIV